MSDPLRHLYETPVSSEQIENIFVWLKNLGVNRDNQGVDFNLLASWVSKFYGYQTPREIFTPQNYTTFYDWFLRKLAPSTLVAARYSSRHSQICSPVEALLRYNGVVGDGQIQLKEGSANIIGALGEIEPLIGSFNFMKFALRKCFYHRVHSPVDGRVLDILKFDRDEDPFGRNATTVVHLETEFGDVFLCAIGERTVQSFHCLLEVGSSVRKLDEVGWFWWGSMVVLMYPADLHWPGKVFGREYFVGDPIL